MNYISKDVVRILVQEVYESKGTTEVDLLEIHEAIKKKFGNSGLPEEFDKLIDESVIDLKDYDASTRHKIVFSDNPFVLSKGSGSYEIKLEDDNSMYEDDDLREIDLLLKRKERAEPKRERSNVRKKPRPRKYNSDEDSDELNKRFARQTSIQEHNRYIREAQKQESDGMRLLREYARACNLGNKVLRGLYDIKDPEKREKELVKLLNKHGERWKDTYPTQEEIQLAKLSTGQEGGEKRRKEPPARRGRGRKIKWNLYSQDPNSDYSE